MDQATDGVRSTNHTIYMLIQLYNRLLVDIAQLSGASLGALENNALEWLLKIGPSLDKKLLAILEAFPVYTYDLPSSGYTEWQRQRYPALVPEMAPADNINVALEDMREQAPHLDELISLFHQRLRCDEYVKAGFVLRWLRQGLLFCYKAEFEFDDLQLRAAEKQFVETDLSIPAWEAGFDPGHTRWRDASRLISRVIANIDWSEISPSHGPGAVYPSCRPSAKSKFTTIYGGIERHYPFVSNFCALPSYWDEFVVKNDQLVESDCAICAKLVAVQKDSRGPRLICVHPKEAIWIQQGHRRLLETAITSHRLTRGRINFTDQTINAKLAHYSSFTQEFCTLDLKDASDRLSPQLIEELFGSPYRFLDCCRAKCIKLLSGCIVPLHKMFPMGNASTFPVESLVFWALARTGIKHNHGVNCDEVYVFGDDIVFPRQYREAVVECLEAANLIVNRDKTFSDGFFRESCGVDAYYSVDVTPLRVKGHDVATVSGLLSLCDLAKRLRLRKYESCSSFIYAQIRSAMRRGGLGRLPISNNPQGQGLFEYVVDRRPVYLHNDVRDVRFSQSSQTWLTATHLERSVDEALSYDSWWNLQDSLLRLAQKGEALSEDGLRYTLPRRTRLVRGWTEIV